MSKVDVQNLEAALRVGKQAATAVAMVTSDGGSNNLDMCYVKLPRVSQVTLDAVSERTGIGLTKFRGPEVSVSAPIKSMGDRDTRQLEEMASALKAAGFDARVHYRLD